MSSRDLSRIDLYESVKLLVESENQRTLHFTQHKLYSLFSIAFQYILFRSTKEPGAYIIRLESSNLVDKLARKSKDASTRRFLQSLSLPRKLKYGSSTFFLDFFNVGTWNLTNEIAPEKIKGSIIVKRGDTKPLENHEDDEETAAEATPLPKDYYLTSLCEISPCNIFISHEEKINGFTEVKFPFIKEEEPRAVSGVKIKGDIKWEDVE